MRSIALAAGLLAALPAIAGEMVPTRPDGLSSARCLATPASKARAGKVASIPTARSPAPSNSRAQALSATRNCQPTRYKSEAGLFVPPCVACRSNLALTSSAQATPVSADRFRDWASPTANLPGMAHRRSWPIACTVRPARSRWACVHRSPSTRTDVHSFAYFFIHSCSPGIVATPLTCQRVCRAGADAKFPPWVELGAAVRIARRVPQTSGRVGYPTSAAPFLCPSCEKVSDTAPQPKDMMCFRRRCGQRVRTNVRFGSSADARTAKSHVRFTSESGHWWWVV